MGNLLTVCVGKSPTPPDNKKTKVPNEHDAIQ